MNECEDKDLLQAGMLLSALMNVVNVWTEICREFLFCKHNTKTAKHGPSPASPQQLAQTSE